MSGRIAFVLLCACTTVANEAAVDPSTTLNEPAFRCKVEPILVQQCSYYACHGMADSALRVYSVGKLRAMPPADSIAATLPLTEDEQHANFTSAAGFAAFAQPAADNWLLRKPLPANNGGYEHAGGAIYANTNDPNYVAIDSWLRGAATCP
jgi:hypothetical protein